jgi:hypothetical protein
LPLPDSPSISAGKGRGGVQVDLASELAHLGALADHRALALGFLAGALERRGLERASEQGAQERRIAGLGHQLDGAERTGAPRVRFLVLPGEHQDAHAGRVREQVADQLEALVGKVRDRRQAEIDERHVGAQARAQPVDGRLAVFAARHVEIGGEGEREAFRDERVVVDDQQAGLLRHAGDYRVGPRGKADKIAALLRLKFPECPIPWSTSTPSTIRTAAVRC